MLKVFVGSSTAYHPYWGEGGEGANSIPQTTQLNFRKRFIYVRSKFRYIHHCRIIKVNERGNSEYLEKTPIGPKLKHFTSSWVQNLVHSFLRIHSKDFF